MRVFYLAVSLYLLSSVSSGAAEWTFNGGREFPGATGAVDEPKAGTLRLRGDFSDGGDYVAADRRAALPPDRPRLSLEVKTAARLLPIRFTDSGQQTHRVALPLTGDEADWQRVTCLPTDATAHWGGKNDGVFRGPATRVQVVLQRTALPGKTGTLRFRDFRFEPADDGATRTVVLDIDDIGWRTLENSRHAMGAVGRMVRGEDGITHHVDFSVGGTLAGMATEIRVPFRGGAVKVKTDARRLRIDLRDARDVSYTSEHTLSGDGSTWQTLPFTRDTFEPQHKNGGGTIHDPVNLILYLPKKGLDGDRGRMTVGGLEILTDTAPRLELPLPEAFFLDAGDNAPLSYPVAGNRPTDTAYRYRDYTGAVVARGEVAYDAEGKTITLPRPPGIGFYDLALPGFGTEFGLLVAAPASGAADPYFGLDFTSSWRSTTYREIQSQMKTLRRFGIVNCRERAAWQELEPERGTFFFEARGGRYDRLRALAAAEGIEILEMFHDTPAWNRFPAIPYPSWAPSGRFPGNNLYPENLLDTARSWREITGYWPAVKALEVWNEPDISFGNHFPPDHVVALTRAVGRHFKRNKIDCTVVGGVFAYPGIAHPGSGESIMYRSYVDAGLLDSGDALSFHSYREVTDMEPMIAGMRAAERELAPERHGLPYWVTECGMPWRHRPERAEINDDRFVAAEIVGNAIELRALGVERYYPFKLGYGNEALNNYGMFDRNVTPMRSMAAYMYLARLLAGKDYVGDLDVPGVTRSRVFSDGQTAVVCLYRPLDKKRAYTAANPLPRRNLRPPPPVALPAVLANAHRLGPDGRPLSLEHGKLPMGDGLAYLVLDKAALGTELRRNTAAAELYRLARAYRAPKPSDASVVAQPAHDMGKLFYDTHGYQLSAETPITLRFHLNNLSDRPATVSPVAKAPPGVRVADFPDGPIVIQPWNRATLSFTLVSDADFRKSPFVLADADGRMDPLRMALRSISPPIRLGVGGTFGESVGVPPGAGKPGIEARFRVAYTPEALKLVVVVDDESHHCDFPAERAWQGDSLQFGLQFRESPDAIGRTRVYEFGVARTAGGVGAYRYQPRSMAGVRPAIRSEIERREAERKTEYHVEIPAKELGRDGFHPGDLLGFTLVVNSHDGKKRVGALSWGKGVDGTKRPQEFNLLSLLPVGEDT